jgi:hypothetical protein
MLVKRGIIIQQKRLPKKPARDGFEFGPAGYRLLSTNVGALLRYRATHEKNRKYQ